MRAWFRHPPTALIPWLGRLATLLMLALLAWLCASLFWAWNTPSTARPASNTETDPQRVARSIVSHHLFGIAPQTTAPTAAAAPTNIRLTGIIAATAEDQPAFALLAIDGKPPQVIKAGSEIAPGLTLQRVLPRQIELARGASLQTLSLPERSKP